MSLPTQLYLLRHGEVEASAQGVFVGARDVELSPRGHEQAAALAAYLAERPMDAVYASPMRRVRQTLAPWQVHRPEPAVILPGLSEVDMGVWTGLNNAEVEARFHEPATNWLEQIQRGAVAGAETGERFRARVEPCVRRMLEDHAGQRVAVVCHGGVIRMILALLLRMELGHTACFHIEYASLTRVDARPAKVRVQLLNFTPWRDLPSRVANEKPA